MTSSKLSQWSDQGTLTWKILLLHCWTMPNIIEVNASSVTWSSKFTFELTITASDISVASVSIIWNVRFRNSVMKSSNFAVDRHTSFSTYSSQHTNDVFCMKRGSMCRPTSVRSLRVLTADEQSTHVTSMSMALRNWKVTAVFLKSLASMPGSTAVRRGRT